MKKAVAITAAALLCISSWGQVSARDLIALFRGSGSVSCSYSYTAKGDFPVNGGGTALISGNCYRLSDSGAETWCDGKTVWTVDRAGKEVVITDGSVSPLARLEEFADVIHIHSFDGESLSCSLVSAAQGLDIDLRADGIRRSSEAEDPAAFSFDTSSLGKDWIITDLR